MSSLPLRQGLKCCKALSSRLSLFLPSHDIDVRSMKNIKSRWEEMDRVDGVALVRNATRVRLGFLIES